jgi:hypothetical protein
MGYIIVYVKVIDDKKDGLRLDGPLASEINDSLQEAEDEARKLINGSRNCTLIPRIYEIGTIFEIEAAMNEAKEYFNNMWRSMAEAKETMCRPIRRKRRRKVTQ